MALLNGISLQLRVGVPCWAVGLVLFLTSFSVQHWLGGALTGVRLHGGLWWLCWELDALSDCVSYEDDWWGSGPHSAKGWTLGAQVLECLALMSVIACLVSSVIHVVTKIKAALIASLVFCCLAGALSMAGAITYSQKFNSIVSQDTDEKWSQNGVSLTWGFVFNIMASIFFIIAGVALLLHICFGTRTSNTPT